MNQTQPTEDTGFQGLRVAAFESRMAESMANLIRRFGGEPRVAPALREIPLSDNYQAFEFGERLFAAQIDMVLLLTGVGTQTLVETLATRHPIESITQALARTTLVARGPKPVAALKRLGLTPDLIVPEPNTWRDLLAALDQQGSVKDRQVAIQEYGVRPRLKSDLPSRISLDDDTGVKLMDEQRNDGENGWMLLIPRQCATQPHVAGNR